MKDLISIIVPIYNAEKYLKRCVESILSQTFKNIEVILIDDGSTDESGRICDEYKDKDSRVIVIHTDNNGLSNARNIGLDAASGNYTGFVDSDDYIEPNMYELLYNALIDHHADISICSRYVEDEDKKTSVSWARKKGVTDLTNEQAMKMMMPNSDFNVAVWDKLYRSELFSGIRFPSGKIYEDNYVTVQLFHLSSSICYLPVPLYHYTQRSESLMHADSVESVKASVEAKKFIKDFICEYNPAIVESADLWLTVEYIAALNRCLKNGFAVSPGLKDELLRSVRKNWLCGLKMKDIDMKAKIQMLLIRISCRLYCAVYILWKCPGKYRRSMHERVMR